MKHIFSFKSNLVFFNKERLDIKNNTVRKIDLSDNRFLDLIYWSIAGWNDGDIKIEICLSGFHPESFTRNIRSISIWNDLMIITWFPLNSQFDNNMWGKPNKKSIIKLNNKYSRQLQEIEKLCDTFADNLQDKKDRSIGTTTMLSYLVHIKQLAGGVIK